MAYATQRPGRVGQSKYWTIFGIYMLVVPALLLGGLYAIFTGQVGLGLLAIVLMLPLGVYFRITMMRRCRDIGWPTFVPWLLFAVPIGVSLFGGFGLGAPGVPSLGMLATPLLVALVDFAFAIVIGCIATKEDEDLAQLFGPGPGDHTSARPFAHRADPRPDAPRQESRTNALGEPDYSSFDAAVARALEARRNPEPQAPPAAAPDPAAHARAVASFGRRRVV